MSHRSLNLQPNDLHRYITLCTHILYSYHMRINVTAVAT